MVKVIVFDANETLLDLGALDPAFASAFGDAAARKEWFLQLQELFLTATIVGAYRSFAQLADEAITMIAARRHQQITPDDRAAIQAATLASRAHPDVLPALDRLRDAGIRCAVLTNSGEKAAKAQAKHAGIDDRFERVLSVEPVKCFKPGRAAYEYAAAELNVQLGEIRLVAAHAWDIAGARAAGCRTGFVARPDKAPATDSAPPDIEGAGLLEVVERILAVDA